MSFDSSRPRVQSIALATAIVAFAVPAGSKAAAGPAPLAQQEQALQLEKLKLDVSPDQLAVLKLQRTKLDQDTSFEGRARPFVPALSVFVALVGGAVGISRYRREQELNRWLQIHQDIAANVGRIVEYPEPGKGFNGAVVASLRNLNELFASLGQLRRGLTGRRRPPPASQDPSHRSDELSGTLATIVLNDLDFTNANHARFPTICLSEAMGYRAFVGNYQQVCVQTLHRYELALQHVYSRDTAYYGGVTRRGGLYVPPPRSLADPTYQLFVRAVHGYEQYVALLQDDAAQSDAVDRFYHAINNRTLTGAVFQGARGAPTVGAKESP